MAEAERNGGELLRPARQEEEGVLMKTQVLVVVLSIIVAAVVGIAVRAYQGIHDRPVVVLWTGPDGQLRYRNVQSREIVSNPQAFSSEWVAKAKAQLHQNDVQIGLSAIIAFCLSLGVGGLILRSRRHWAEAKPHVGPEQGG